MRRLFATVALLLAMLAGSLAPALALAQDTATPQPDDQGPAVTLIGSDGQEEGTIEVTSVVDPFEDYDPSTAPDRGFHFVMATVTMSATGARELEVNAYGFTLVDTDGFVYQPAFVYRPRESMDATPDLAADPLPAGQSVSGAVFFQVLDNTTPALVLYQPSSYDRLVTAADLRDAAVEQGDTVTFIASDGSPAGTISVDDYIQPVQDYDSSSAPQRGFEYVAIVVTITNDGANPLEVDPSDVFFVDADGFSYYGYTIYRTQDAEAQTPTLQYTAELAPGDSISGLIGFQVLAGTKPGFIYYAPDSERHIRIAEYAEGQAPKPSGTPKANTGLSRAETPEADTTPVPSADCEGALDWGTASIENITKWSEAIGAIGGMFSGKVLDPADVRAAADTSRELADAQEKLDTPAIAEDASAKLVELFSETAKALDSFADAVESGDETDQAVASQNVVEIVTQASNELDTMLQDLVDACPELQVLEGGS